MVRVHLRPITVNNVRECLRLRVNETQENLVATNAQSLAETKANPELVPLAVYDEAARGYPTPAVAMIGFTTYELTLGVGFILRLMIDRAHQRKGYGRATVLEVIRRLRLHPEVEMIATSHRQENEASARLFGGLGFVPYTVDGGRPGEVFLRLPDGR
jgi:diamine N-acetyltransferase